ncbi:MAG: ferredoxin, partial [Gemmatimonadales bacterium]
LVIAVDVGSSGMVQGGLQDAGFASIYARAQEIAILTMKETKLAAWETPPLILLQPRIGHVSMFSFEHNEFFVAEGNKAAFEVLSRPDQIPGPEASGVYPRRAVNVRVDPERCIGCGACLVHGPPGLFEINGDGKALVTEPEQEWSPTDGGYVRQCPTYAIIARADRDSFGGRART